ncbi:MAG: hypothetical protein JXR84_17555 [Anaerolineae bacterium]|nr:hypothetical protein [Anaerolineae bacterium]
MERYTRWAWVTMIVLALLLRLAALNGVLLAPDEATAALASWDAAHGAGWAGTADSPLLLVGNGLLFLLFGAGDGLARLLPALAGVALVGLPWFWRKHLGEVGALVAAGLLLCSPLVLFAARRVDGASLGLLGAALLLTALLAHDTEGWPARHSSALIIAGLAIGLTGGPVFYDALIAGVLAWLLYRWIVSKSDEATPRLTTSLSAWTGPALWGLLGALLISTGLGLRWNGWSGVADGLAAWLASWRVPRTGLASAMLLFLYEPATLLLVLLGLGWAIKKTLPLPLALGLWGFFGLLLVSLRPGATTLALTVVVLPLALLAGYGVQQTMRDIPTPVFKWMALHGLVGFVFWQPVGLALARHASGIEYSAFGNVMENTSLFLLLSGVTLIALQVLIALLFSLKMPLRLVWRGAALGLALILLVTQTGFAWGLAFVRPDSTAEPAVATAASPDLLALRAMLDGMAVQSGQRRDDFSVTVMTGDVATAAVVRWALRDFARLTVAEFWPAEVAGVVVATSDVAPPDTATLAWEGMAFTALARGIVYIPACQSLVPLTCNDLASWYLFRQTPDTLVPEQVILWRAR